VGIFFALFTLDRAASLSPKLVPFAIGAWVAGLTLSLVAYGFWTDSLFATFALTGFAFALLDHRVRLRANVARKAAN
jgi:FtsH-binding integral membrane protein